ncbi:hypothetical protein D3C87_936850 [compost metagenome]
MLIDANNMADVYQSLVAALVADPSLAQHLPKSKPLHQHIVMPTNLMLSIAGEQSVSYSDDDRCRVESAWFFEHFEIVGRGDLEGAKKEYCPAWIVIKSKDNGNCYRFTYARPCTYHSGLSVTLDNYYHADADNTPFVMLEPVVYGPAIAFSWMGGEQKKEGCLRDQNMYHYNDNISDEKSQELVNMVNESNAHSKMECIMAMQAQGYYLIVPTNISHSAFAMLYGEQKIPLAIPEPIKGESMKDRDNELVWLARYELAKIKPDFSDVREAVFGVLTLDFALD